jgi:hypothetical protein
MDLSAILPITATQSRRRSIHIQWPAVSAWTLGFALVTYLALRDGGYDTVVRSEVGIAIWWIILLAALAGSVPLRFGRRGWAAILLLGGFAIWTALASTWSQSPEQSVMEIGREAAYLGFLVIALALQGRAPARHTINGVACAIGLVTVLALLSRLHPQAFPVNVQFRFLGADAGRRLSYPLNYWNALAAFVAIGVPLFVALAIGARTALARSVAAAMLPLSALCIYLTVSRGGVLELGVGIAVFMLLAPRRIDAAVSGLLGIIGSAILVWAAQQRPAIQTGLRNTPALHAGAELLLLTVVVCSGVALLQAAVTLVARNYRRPAWLAPNRRTTTRAALVAGVLALIVAVGVGVPGKLDHVWQQFKAPTGAVVPTNGSTVIGRLGAINGNGRYQYWVAAGHAFEKHPVGGIGPGTFQFWWAEHATVAGPVLNAHSLYMETLAETGVIGLALLLGLFLLVIVVAIRRALREPDSIRLWVAAAAAGFATFMAAAALEWVWQMAAIVAVVMALAAVILAGRDDALPLDLADRADDAAAPAKPRMRAAVVAWALIAVLAISVPLAGTIALRDSQTAANQGNLSAAYNDARVAAKLQPYAASPYLQEALVLELGNRLGPAVRAARIATAKSPTDWKTWLTLARIESEAGQERRAVAALAVARRLNPLGSVFTAA